MIRVTENLAAVRLELENVAEVAARKPSDIRLIAVSKRHSVDAIRAAHAAGQVDFGENFVDEALGKIASLGHKGYTWHYIGAIQSNKTRDIASHFDWVHTSRANRDCAPTGRASRGGQATAECLHSGQYRR